MKEQTQKKKIKYYMDYKVGERWDTPTTKITLKIPTNLIDGFLAQHTANRGATISWWASMFLMHGVACYIKALERQVEAKEAGEREERKRRGYYKRSLRRYGMLGEDEELDDT